MAAADDVKLIFHTGASPDDRVPIVADDLRRFTAIADALRLSAVRPKHLHRALREKDTNGLLDVAVLKRTLAALAREQEQEQEDQDSEGEAEAAAEANAAVERVFQALMSSSRRVTTAQMATALSMFTVGSKSEKIALAFRALDRDGDGVLTRAETTTFLEAFLTPILALCRHTADKGVTAVRRMVASCVEGVCDRLVQGDACTFSAFKGFYNGGGFGIMPWLEITDLHKWALDDEDSEGAAELLAFDLTSTGEQLRITQRDVDNLAALLAKTGFDQMDPEELVERVAAHGEPDGGDVLTREGFDAAILDLVPREVLGPNDAFFLARALTTLFYAFDRAMANEVPLTEFAAGFTLLAAGAKSEKLHAAWNLLAPEDGLLSRDEVAVFLGCFLTALLTLGQQSSPTPAHELQGTVDLASREAADKIWGALQPAGDRITFLEFGRAYNSGLFESLRFLELLQLTKWPASTAAAAAAAAAAADDSDDSDDSDWEPSEDYDSASSGSGSESEDDEDQRYAADVSADELDGLEDDVLLLDFTISDSNDVLQFTAKDVRALRRIVRETGMGELVVEELYSAFATRALQRVDKDTFEELLSAVVDEDLLEEDEDISDSLFAAFFMFTDDREEASLVELLAGLSVFIGGSKSHKLYNAFQLFDDDDDGLLARGDMERYLGAFLSVLLSLSGCSDPRVVRRAVADVCDRVFAAAADDAGLVSFEDFADWYTNKSGYTYVMWLELLDLRKVPGNVAVDDPAVYDDWGARAAAEASSGDDDVESYGSSSTDEQGDGQGEGEDDDDDVVVYRFRMDDRGRVLEISQQDIANIEYIATKTRLQTVTVERVITLFEQRTGGMGGSVTARDFEAVAGDLVPGLSAQDQQLLSSSLAVVFAAFDRTGSGEAPFAEVVTGVCLFAAASKSVKLAACFDLFASPGRDGLTRGQTFRFMRSWLTTLFALSSEVGGQPAEIARRTRAGATTAVKDMFADGEDSDDAVMSFTMLADWYSARGYQVAAWLELLSLQKWALLRTVEEESAAVQPPPAPPAAAAPVAQAPQAEADDGLVFSFDIAPQFKLQITAADIDTLNAVLSKTRLHTVELETLYEVFHAEARNGRISKRAFNQAVQELVPADVLTPEDKAYLNVALANVFYAFDRLRRHEVSVRELLCGFSLLCAGSKSAKLAQAFNSLDEDGDGLLSRRETWVFLRSFLMTLLALNHCSASVPSDELYEAADACAVRATADIFASAGATTRISFECFSSFYNEVGFTTLSFLELSDLSKWPHSAAGSRADAEEESPVVFGFEMTDFVLTIDERDLTYLERVLAISGLERLSVDDLLAGAGELLERETITFDEAVEVAARLLPNGPTMAELEHEFLRGVLRDLFHGYRVVSGGDGVRPCDFFTGLSLLVGGNKSTKLAATFELAGADLAALRERELAGYLCAFLTALLVLSNASQADLDKAQAEATRIARGIFQQQGEPRAVSFEGFAEFYSATGSRDIPWIELLATSKWGLR